MDLIDLTASRNHAASFAPRARRRGSAVGTVLLCLLLAACSRPMLAPLSDEAVILAFGDSVTLGVGADPAHSYPAQLALLAERRVVNAGVSGETSAQGLARLPSVLAQHDPDLMILLIGGNDILRNLDPLETRANIADMLRIARAEAVPVVLIGVPEKALFSRSAPFYRELAAEYRLVFEGILVASLLRNPSYKSDPIHLNAQGYREMAERLYRLLVDHGALDP